MWSTASDCVLINYSPKAISRRRQDGSTHLRARAGQRHNYIHPFSTGATEIYHGPNITSLDQLRFIGSCVLTLISILRTSLLVVINYSDRSFGLVSKFKLLETNTSLKGMEESSSSVFPIVDWSSVRDICVCYWYLFDRGAECEVDRLCLLALFSPNYILSVPLIVTTCEVSFYSLRSPKMLMQEMQNPPFTTTLTFLTLRQLMSYIYGAPILDVSRSHTTTHYSR